MLPLVHFIASVIGVILLFPIYKYWSLAFFIGSFLIDFDHYLWHIIKNKNFSLKKAYFYHHPSNKYRDKDLLHIFHVWEFWLLMLILAFFNIFFLMVFLGMVYHLIFDMVDLFMHKKYDSRAMSYFAWLKRH